MTVSGSGFQPGSSVSVKWRCGSLTCPSTTILSVPTADSSGAFITPISIPTDATAGTYPIAGVDTLGIFAKAPFTVLPVLSRSPTSVHPGSSFDVSGSAYNPGSTVTLRWNCPSTSCSSVTVLATPVADDAGVFSVSVTAPVDSTAGSYAVGGKDSLGAFAKASLKILPTMSISPRSGPAGSTATVTGDAYQPGETVTVLWNSATSSCGSTTVLATPTADGTGHFSVSVTIPTSSVSVGTKYKLRGKGGSSSGISYTSFKITSL